MEMVSASKMRRAQERMRVTRPYAEKMRNVICHLATAHPEYEPAYLIERPAKARRHHRHLHRPRLVRWFERQPVQDDRDASMKEWREQGSRWTSAAIGSKAGMFFKRLGGNVVARRHTSAMRRLSVT